MPLYWKIAKKLSNAEERQFISGGIVTRMLPSVSLHLERIDRTCWIWPAFLAGLHPVVTKATAHKWWVSQVLAMYTRVRRMTAVWHVGSYSRYHIIRVLKVAAITDISSTRSITQAANKLRWQLKHHLRWSCSGCMLLLMLFFWRRGRPPYIERASHDGREPVTAKGSEWYKSTCCFTLCLGIVDNSGPI